MVGLKSEGLRSKFVTSIPECCSSIVPCHFEPIIFLQRKSARAGFSCPLIPQKTKEDYIKKTNTVNAEEVSINAAFAAEPSSRHVLQTWPLPPTGGCGLSQLVSASLCYRNSLALLKCNSLASPCQIPSFFLYQMSTRDKSKRFRKHSSEAGPFFVRSRVSSSECA